MMGNAESSQWSEDYNSIKQTHDAAYKAIDEAIKLEEQEMPYEVISIYSIHLSCNVYIKFSVAIFCLAMYIISSSSLGY